MTDTANPPELRRPFMQPPLTDQLREQLVDDVTQICQRVRYVECAPARLWESGLVTELADAVDRLAVKVGQLQEAGGDR